MYKSSILLFILGLISCNESPNQFTPEANAFLDAINGKEYTGQGSFSTSTFQVNNTIIAEYRTDGQPTIALRFQKTRNNNASKTEGIYQELRGTQYYGIVLSDSGNTLGRTPAAASEEAITWSTAPVFAKQKK